MFNVDLRTTYLCFRELLRKIYEELTSYGVYEKYEGCYGINIKIIFIFQARFAVK